MYQFQPSPDRACNNQSHVWWDDGFSIEEIKTIIKMGEEKPLTEPFIGVNVQNEEYRKSKVSWIDSEKSWLTERLAFIARELNGQFFEYDLWGFGEDFQYTTYSDANEHYDWHMDSGPNGDSPRKLSLVLLLSDPYEFEGGDLQIKIGRESITLDKVKGRVYAFPSYILHRVTPVTEGLRRTLVSWICGPKFR